MHEKNILFSPRHLAFKSFACQTCDEQNREGVTCRGFSVGCRFWLGPVCLAYGSPKDAITAELPVANGVVAANPDLAIVMFEEGKGFVVDTSVSIAVAKENTELLNAIQNALNGISEEQRLQIMEDAIGRQPASEE